MKSGLSWEMKGLRPRARETARTAARRAGMSVGEWLDTVILNSADEDHLRAGVASDDAYLEDGPYELEEPKRPGRSADANLHRNFSELNERIDGLARQVTQLARLTGERAKLSEPRDDDALRQLAGLVGKLDRRLDQVITESRSAKHAVEERVDAIGLAVADLKREQTRAGGVTPAASPLDRAMVEIAERQRALDGYSPALPDAGSVREASALPRARTQELSALEQQLRDINRQMEKLGRPCGVHKAIDGLRDDLAELGAMLQDAMPRKSVEALEEATRKLAERIEGGRNAGVDAPALASVEKGLAELRETVRGLGNSDNLGKLDRALQDLSRKIDGIAQNSEQPGALRGIETALATMRSTVSRVASNDALAKLSDEVRGLAGKLDRNTESGGSDMLAMLEKRIAALADALHARNEGGQATPPELDRVINTLAEKIEHVQQTRADPDALRPLEERIAKLIEKLDGSDTRLNQLEAIERGLTELLTRVGRQSVPDVALDVGTSGRTELSREVAELKQTDKETRESLEAVHGTLGHVVDRLAMIETDMRGNARARARAAKPKTPGPTDVGQEEARPLEPFIGHPEQLTSAASARPIIETATEHVTESIDTPREMRNVDIPASLAPDHPLEPRVAGGQTPESPTERIAASDAALDEVKTATVSEPIGKSDFIAAARRAAQAAARQAPGKNTSKRANDIASAAGKLANRVGKLRGLIAGSSVILLVLGSLELARTLLNSAPEESGAPARVSTLAQPQAETAAPTRASESAAVATNADKEHATAERTLSAGEAATLPNATVSRPASMTNLPLEIARQATASLQPTQVPTQVPSQLPTQGPTETERAAEVTGSIPAGASAAKTGVSTPPVHPVATPQTGHASDNLPAGLGPNLRAAALKGEAAAEFEVAVRLAEGRGVPQNMPAAAEWFERAAKKGLAPAQFRLAGLYEKGLGVKKNLETARRYYSAAGVAGHAKALHNLAVLYAEGVDGKPDYQTAARWFRKAAGYGVADSQYNLAVLYTRGIGVEQNLAEAYKWFALAARDGDAESARKRDDLATHLDQRSLQAALQAIQAFVPEQQPEASVLVKTPAGGWDQVTTSSSLPPPKRRVVGPKLDLATPTSAQ
jgi:localization factor PodJL